jgi:flagellar hook-associated protein 1
MSNLFSILQSSASAMDVFQNALSVTSNNVTNASTPGYVLQTQGLEALPFDSTSGLSGGVAATKVESARDVYAERAVQLQTTSLGTWEQQVTTLSPLDGDFDTTGTTGIPGALNNLYSACSTWSSSPSDSTARQGVLTAAQAVAQAFQQQSTELDETASSADSQLSGLVDQVNQLAGTIQQDNVQRQSGSGGDSSVDASLYNALEQLSELVPIQTLQQPDGSMTVLLAGQIPLVVGQQQYKISSNVAVPDDPAPTNPTGPPSDRILDSSGQDVTSLITQGQVGGLLQARNGTLATLRGDSQQQGQLSKLAQSVADRVNAILESGTTSDGTAGVALFTYNAADPSGIAKSLSVDSTVTPDQLAAVAPGPPEVSNGIPLALAGLATPQSADDEINNLSYTEYYGGMASTLGAAISTAQSNQTVHQNLVTQAQDLRQQTSGVSLDTEAIKVLQFQRSYQAVSKMVTMLDDLTQTVINMIQ